MEEHINLKKILYNAVTKNTELLLSIILLLLGYFLQDFVFFRSFGNFTSNVPNFIENMSLSSVMIVIMPYIVAETLFYINNIIVSYSIPKIELEVIEELTKQTLESLQDTKKTINTNEFIMKLKKVLESKNVYYLFVLHIVPTILISMGILYYFTIADKKTGFVVFLLMMIFSYIVYEIFKQSVMITCENENTINKYYDEIQDVIVNSDLVITSNTKETEIINLANKKDNVYETYLNSETTSSENSFGLRLLCLGFIIVLDSIAIYLFSHNKMSTEHLTTICITSIIFLKYFNNLVSRFRSSLAYLGKFHEINDYFENFKLIPKNIKNIKNNLKITNGNIDFSKISLKIGDKQILNNFNFKIKGQTKICIVGEMGSGKTTILKMLCGLVNYNGNITIDGQNLKECCHESICNHIAYIQQHPKMFNRNIYDNISYGSNKSKEEVITFLKQMKLNYFFKMFPDGLDSQAGKDGSKLSGGQKQLIAIIRALLQNKSIILLDEPTSSLDVQTKSSIIELIKQIEGKTILVVTHDQSLLSMSSIFDDYVSISQ